MLYPLYALAEVAIVATDLAELLGSAIAICLLFPWIPLYAGVLLTGADVLVLLAMRNPLDGKPVMFFEIIIAVLVRIPFARGNCPPSFLSERAIGCCATHDCFG